MAARKFGTFGGVFTPAILTILGVIMYMRLPWIVGNAGMYAAMGIVVVAHVISVTTGLSVSSIATDKKVKAGGSYFIISRSLGLPIGGTLGFALFIGLSFSVSLYLIGFSESMLQTLGVEATTDTIRICGTLTLIAVTTITFISTSLAIKTQYIIMALIAISLVSILVGNSSLPAPTEPHLEALEGGASLAVLFGIFFPAVTGFEAGVSMSGDLKDPKKSIPGGTMAAIVFGLVAYIALSAFLAYRIPAEELANNPRVLLDYSFHEALVVPGIWGATISSSLGSILGAPRILQAVAADRIGPKFATRIFAKGFGPDNEPRNALLLTFLIAESGILIGSLDTIARVVSMFFMASYAFLNVSCAIESWVSPDFRPDFRIPRVVSVIGALTCLLLMIQLDAVAMMGSLVLLGSVFLLLQRQQLVLETGDTWNGVWSSLVRAGLERLQSSESHERNWRPHVLAFTGAGESAEAVRALGRTIVEKRGVLTEFQLLPADTPTPPADDDEGIRHRVDTEDRWQTMQSVTRFHGLPGLEPNTVLVDWSFLGSQPERARQTLDVLGELDRNVLLSVIRGEHYGGGERVDVWWVGRPRNLSLALSLVRFLTLAEEWRTARLRFLATVSDPVLRRGVQQRLAQWLREARVEAEVRVLDPLPEGEELHRRIASVSADADMLMVGLEDDIDPDTLRARVSGLGRSDRMVLFLRASPVFADPFPEPRSVEAPATEEPALGADVDLGDLPEPVAHLPSDRALAVHPLELRDGLDEALGRLVDELVVALGARRRGVVDEVERVARRAIDQLDRTRDERPLARRHMTQARIQLGTLQALQRTLATFRDEAAEQHRLLLEAGIGDAIARLGDVERSIAEEIELTLPEGDGEPVAGRAEGASRFRVRRVPLRREVVKRIDAEVVPALDEAILRARDLHQQGLDELDGLVTWTLPALERIVARLAVHDAEEVDLSQDRMDLELRLQGWREREAERARAERNRLQNLCASVAGQIGALLLDPPGRRLSLGGRTPGQLNVEPETLVERFAPGFDAQALLLTRTSMDLSLQAMHHRLRESASTLRGRLNTNIRQGALEDLGALVEAIDDLRERLQEDPAATLAEVRPPTLELDESELIERLLEAIEGAVAELPETLQTLSDDAFQDLAEGRVDEVEPMTVEVRRLVNYILETDLVGALREDLARLGQALNRASSTVHDVMRFVTADERRDASVSERAALTEERVHVLRSAAERVERQREGVQRALDRLLTTLGGVVSTAIDRTQAAAIADAAGKMGRFIRTYQQQQLLDRAGTAVSAVSTRARRSLVDLSVRYTRGVLLARQLQSQRDPTAHRVEQALGLRLEAAPSVEVIESLPIFYRRVFLGTSARDPAYWVGQEAELERAARAVTVHRQGHPGALLVTGPPGAGLSSLTERILRASFDAAHTFEVRAPEGGATDPARFRRALEAALGVAAPAERALRGLPAGSVVVVHDLELWFERQPGGLEVIDTIAELIDAHGDRTLFLLTCNEYTFQLLRRLGRLDDQLMATVHCRPLDAGSLREAVMLRHEAAGLALRIADAPEDEPGEFALARLFGGLFEATGGYLGPALQAWIGHIARVDDEVVVLSRPRALDLDALDRLDDAWVAVLIELVLHRRMSLQRLVRVSGQPEAELARDVRSLVRAGLVVETSDGTLSLDPFAAHHVHYWLSTREVL